MEKKQISIHRALAELKRLNGRIINATNEINAITVKRKSVDKINGKPVAEAKKDMQATYDKVVGLIQYRDRLKTLVVQSNAETMVTVANEKMTVAQAIERKASIIYEIELLKELKRQYANAVRELEKHIEELPEKLETYLVNILGTKEKRTEDEVKLHTETYLRRNEHELVDPIHLKKIIDKLEAKIEEFEADVDAVLSESNAVTMITV